MTRDYYIDEPKMPDERGADCDEIIALAIESPGTRSELAGAGRLD